MAYVTLGTAWEDGATLAEIEAARQLLAQDMKILEGIAPESGAYFNEVSFPRTHTRTCTHPVRFSHPSVYPPPLRRLRDTNSTGRNPSSVVITTSSGPSSRNTIRTLSSSFTRVSDQTSGTQISSAESETASERCPHPMALTCTFWVGCVLASPLGTFLLFLYWPHITQDLLEYTYLASTTRITCSVCK